MKKILLSLSFISIVALASAQHIRLNVYSSYVFDDGFDAYNNANSYYNGKVSAGVQWGGGIEYLADPSYGVELLYYYKNSDVPSRFKVGTLTTERNETLDLTQHYILLSGNRHMETDNHKVTGYGGLILGMVISEVDVPSNGNHSSNSNFAWGARLGTDIWLTPKIGLKLQAQILSATRASGGDLYYGYWGPVAVPDYSTLWQFGLGGGLAFKMGK
jgi:hypothetical protein